MNKVLKSVFLKISYMKIISKIKILMFTIKNIYIKFDIRSNFVFKIFFMIAINFNNS